MWEGRVCCVMGWNEREDNSAASRIEGFWCLYVSLIVLWGLEISVLY